MGQLRLKTQLLISSLLIICALTGAILLIVRHTVRSEIDEQVREGTVASVEAFQAIQQERELQLSRTAAMLSELPTLKALMTTQHSPRFRMALFLSGRLRAVIFFFWRTPVAMSRGCTSPVLDSIPVWPRAIWPDP